MELKKRLVRSRRTRSKTRTGFVILALLGVCSGGTGAAGYQSNREAVGTEVTSEGGLVLGPDGVRLLLPRGALAAPQRVTWHDPRDGVSSAHLQRLGPVAMGVPSPFCAPSCAGRQCGPDGCGFACGPGCGPDPCNPELGLCLDGCPDGACGFGETPELCPADCPPTRALYVLLVVDNSMCMTQEQELLSQELQVLPYRLTRLLGEAVDLHLRVTTTDLGTAPYYRPYCEAPKGWSERMRTANQRLAFPARRQARSPQIQASGYVPPWPP